MIVRIRVEGTVIDLDGAKRIAESLTQRKMVAWFNEATGERSRNWDEAFQKSDAIVIVEQFWICLS